MLKLWEAVVTTIACVYLARSVISAPAENNQLAIFEDPEIKLFHVQSLVISRYAFTTIVCKIYNPSTLQKEALFSVLLPANAFISNLTIEAGGYNYTSVVQEKEEARKTYETAKVKGNNAAIVHQKERETSRFRVDVSIAPQDEVIFYLSYEELLERSLGKYTLKVNIHPNYIVRDVMVDVTIHETRPFSMLKVVKVPGGDDFLSATSQWGEGNLTARFQFDPDPDVLPKDKPLHGQLVIEYDVKRALDAGDVQIEDGYFVHFFAPVELQHTPKYISFLIDTSGSMSGVKIKQVKEALKKILKDLNKGDYFSITEFSDSATKLIDAPHSPGAVKKAYKIIESLEAGGGTNIDHGIKETLIVDGKEREGVMSHIIILLTDGQPTVGVQNSDKILKNARERNRHGATIFCLGFGDDADTDLLQRLAYQNGGTNKKIYQDFDAADQLQNFYKSLSTPLLLDVRFNYSSEDINMKSISKSTFQNYFLGTELVVTGQIQKNHRGGIRATITGEGRNGKFTMGVTEYNTVTAPDRHLLDHLHLAPTPRKFIKRLWAFIMVKELLNQDKAAVEKKDRILARQRALHLALEYQFVTPLTSLVVVQPDSQRCKDYEDEDQDQEEGEDRDPQPPTDADAEDIDNQIDDLAGQDKDKLDMAVPDDQDQLIEDEDYPETEHDFSLKVVGDYYDGYIPNSHHPPSSSKGMQGTAYSSGSQIRKSSAFTYLFLLPLAYLLISRFSLTSLRIREET